VQTNNKLKKEQFYIAVHHPLINMRKKYQLKKLLFISGSLLLLFIASCKKDNKNNNKITTPTATPKVIGFYAVDSSIYKVLLMNISQIGTKPTNFDLIYDTGSGGMVIDANGILPASMITSTGFNLNGADSTVVDGITITSQTNIIEYGDDDATTSKVYGNLAYAAVTIGDQNGNIVVKRLPFFLYWKATNASGTIQQAHDFDVFGVSSEYDITFGNAAFITSPFSYFDPGTGLTKGFKMGALGTTSYTELGNYVPDITLGLTTADLSTAGGFSLSPLQFESNEGYLPIFQAKLSYGGGASFTGYVLFDTGTEPYSYLQDPSAATNPVLLANSTNVSITLNNSNFHYGYTTSAGNNLTYVENPTNSGSIVSVVGLDFFDNNSYLLDFQNNQLGLKAN
jgi:hypothetical protein